MTKARYRELMRKLIKVNTACMRKNSEKVLSSGCVDLESQPDDYTLPKAAMCAMSREMAFQWQPASREGKKEALNIEMFL